MQVSINSGAAAHALARHILANVKDDPSAEGALLTQEGSGVYVATEGDSAHVSLNGAVATEE